MHIAIIIDGNRRFAKKILKEPWKGHESGAERVEKLFDWCDELNVKQLTLYALSIENLKRSEKEVAYLMKIFDKELRKLKEDKRLEERKIKIKFIGQRELLGKDLQNLMKEIEEKTKNNDKFFITFAVAYGGRQEIIDAVKKIISENKEINEENFQDYLWMPDSPDFIIRTGGEKRTSNFLPWQSVYSEWIFLDKLWPEFEKQDLIEAIEEFNKRERRFGK
ncbi:MAG: polyprenyl diphosphate synthase [Nanoarchaeota archaeon]|nr:polyprenyl diphosphate synthase [Nanoarchaeota archaeon]